jgi:hypothetical protein
MTNKELISALNNLDCDDDINVELWSSGYHADTFTSLNDIALTDYADGTQAIQLSY